MGEFSDPRCLPLCLQELLNWNEVAIIVRRKEIKSIPQLIKEFDLPRAQALMAQYRHMWTFEFVCQYIFDRLRNERCFPAPFSALDDYPDLD